MYFWKYILAKKAGLSQKKCNMALYGLPVLPIAEAFEKTVTGNPISVTDALAQDALSLQVAFTPTQDGTPSIDSEPTTEPYLSKVVPRGNKEYYSLVGGTVVWNQLVQNGDFASTSGWSSTYASIGVANNICTVTPQKNINSRISHSLITVTGHKYFFSAMIKPSASTRVVFTASNSSIQGLPVTSIGANVWNNYSTIGNANAVSANFNLFVNRGETLTSEDSVDVQKVQISDLTLDLGSTIADYAYSLEQSEAGSGIAWLKSHGFFTKDYYPYNAGGIESVKTSAHKTVGFNQWDEVWENGYIDVTTGLNRDTTQNIRSKNYIPVFPNTTYYLRTAMTEFMWCPIIFYDENKNFVSAVTQQVWNRTITTPSNAHYMRFYMQITYGPTYNHDICINLHWDGERDGEYEPYEEHTYPLDSDLELRGIPKLDSANKLYYDGDTYASDGSVTRRYGIVDLGSLNYTYHTQYEFFYTNISTYAKGSDNCICERYQYMGYSSDVSMENVANNTVWRAGSTLNQLKFKNTAYTDATAFKTAMSGVYLVYEKETPTTESATPYTSPIDVEAGGTEEFVDNRTVPIPVGNETYYASEYAVHGKTGVTVSHGATEDDPNPTEYEVEFTSQGTVYGGTVDIVTGVLTATWAILSNPQNLNWISNSSQGMKNFQTESGTVSKKSGSDNWKCSRYSNGFIGTDKAEGIFIFDSGEVCIRDYRYWEHGGTSAEEAAFKASLADVTIAYELATPQTYTLTPEQVTMLLGNNYLVTEDGTITITYMAGK